MRRLLPRTLILVALALCLTSCCFRFGYHRDRGCHQGCAPSRCEPACESPRPPRHCR